MSSAFSFLLVLFLSIFNTSSSFADESVPERPVKMAIQTFSINNTQLLAISFENFPHWHTYWKNPGDAGLAIKNQFLLNKKEIKLNPIR